MDKNYYLLFAVFTAMFFLDIITWNKLLLQYNRQNVIANLVVLLECPLLKSTCFLHIYQFNLHRHNKMCCLCCLVVMRKQGFVRYLYANSLDLLKDMHFWGTIFNLLLHDNKAFYIEHPTHIIRVKIQHHGHCIYLSPWQQCVCIILQHTRSHVIVICILLHKTQRTRNAQINKTDISTVSAVWFLYNHCFKRQHVTLESELNILPLASA